MMEKGEDVLLLRLIVRSSDKHGGKLLYKYLVELLKKEGLAGVTVTRGIDGFGKSAIVHTSSILRLSTEVPVVLEVVDRREKIEDIKPRLQEIVKRGLITEENVKVVLYEGD